MTDAPPIPHPEVSPRREWDAAEGQAGFLARAGRIRADRAWQWFAVYNPLNVWIDTPPGYEGCSEMTLEAAKRWHTQSLFLWATGMADFRDALSLGRPGDRYTLPLSSGKRPAAPIPGEARRGR